MRVVRGTQAYMLIYIFNTISSVTHDCRWGETNDYDNFEWFYGNKFYNYFFDSSLQNLSDSNLTLTATLDDYTTGIRYQDINFTAPEI